MEPFDTLMARHKDRVYTQAFYILGNAADAQDVSQEVLVKLWKHHASVDPACLGGWVASVTRNACMDSLRKRMRRREVPAEAAEESYAANVPCGRPGPAAAAEQSDFNEALQEALAGIAEPFRSILVLREVQELSYNEISEAQEMPLNTVKVYLHRGRRMLRDALRERMASHA